MNLDKFKFTKKNDFKIKDFSTKNGDEFGEKSDAKIALQKNLMKMADLQDRLYSEQKEGLLVVIQAMDAAGKDGAIKHIFTIFNPAGVNVHAFKQPSQTELSHSYLWRAAMRLPERGKVAIFNRSYYEDVLVGRVHRLYESQTMPKRFFDRNVIERRYEEIKNFERYIYDNGTTILKLFLNISSDEQAKRFLERIDDESKNWKFSHADIKERGYWDKYMEAYEDAINNTATDYAPWYVIPSDKKWYARALISEIVVETMKEMNPNYPEMPSETLTELAECRKLILAE